MAPPADGPGNRLCHGAPGYFIQAVTDPAQAQLPQRRREDLRETLVAKEAEHDRWVGTVQKLERDGGAGWMNAVAEQLAFERVQRAVRLTARLIPQVRRTIDEQAGALDRIGRSGRRIHAG